MISSIAGDIIGSSHESSKKQPFTALFTEKSRFTDDTVLSVATMDAILYNRPYGEKYFEYAMRYPKRGYGGKFKEAIKSGKLEPYDSYGNGSAMRVSPVGWAFDDVMEEAKRSAECSHNNPEGIKGAQAVALIVRLCRNTKLTTSGNKLPKEEIRKIIEESLGYDLKIKMVDFKEPFDVSCQGTIPRCWAIFNETKSFEEAMRAGIDMGGDVDTNCCIAGAFCDAYYGLPSREIVKEVYDRIPFEMANITTEFIKKYIDCSFRPPNVNIVVNDSISSLEI